MLTQQSTHWARGNIECIRQQINLLFAQEWMWSGGNSIPTLQLTCEGSDLCVQIYMNRFKFTATFSVSVDRGKRCWWQLIPATWLHLRIPSWCCWVRVSSWTPDHTHQSCYKTKILHPKDPRFQNLLSWTATFFLFSFLSGLAVPNFRWGCNVWSE
jgi:hypothetical protein